MYLNNCVNLIGFGIFNGLISTLDVFKLSTNAIQRVVLERLISTLDVFKFSNLNLDWNSFVTFNINIRCI